MSQYCLKNKKLYNVEIYIKGYENCFMGKGKFQNSK